MGQVKTHRTRLQSTLLAIILATLPCYLLGLVVLWVGGIARSHQQTTPTITATLPPVPVEVTETPLVPTIQFPTPTITLTPTISPTFTVTSTYSIPTATPTIELTPTETQPAPIETLITPGG